MKSSRGLTKRKFKHTMPSSEGRIEVKAHVTASGNNPFEDWLNGLDMSIKPEVAKRLSRLRLGNFGDHKKLGDGLWELRIFSGPGYRVYFGKDDSQLVILLIGGDKDSQKRDIAKAKTYWRDYNECKNKVP